jgi:exopolysaccharide biosynthesis polyprenyl glycosylphosphotransferase
MYPELFQEVFEMAQLGVSVVPMPIAYEYANGRVPVEHIREKWSLALPLNTAVSPFYLCWRKVMDVIFGLIGTAVLLMILPFLAIFIYIDSPGPIFYRQDRSGVKGKTFRIFKFRSMRIDAEQNGHALWATGDDPRVTRVGRIMRRIHLDELPQVLNILWGDMSLIGPRPEREAFNTQLEKTIPFYRCRLMVKPGLTGWAQVMYHYCSTDNDALIKLQYDLYYIKHQSFMLDICIILKTVIEVILHRGT